MAPLALTTDEYLDAFLHGFEFVLMAMEGRLASRDLGDEAAVAEFLREYQHLLRLHRARRAFAPGDELALTALRVKELEPAAHN